MLSNARYREIAREWSLSLGALRTRVCRLRDCYRAILRKLILDQPSGDLRRDLADLFAEF